MTGDTVGCTIRSNSWQNNGSLHAHVACHLSLFHLSSNSMLFFHDFQPSVSLFLWSRSGIKGWPDWTWLRVFTHQRIHLAKLNPETSELSSEPSSRSRASPRTRRSSMRKPSGFSQDFLQPGTSEAIILYGHHPWTGFTLWGQLRPEHVHTARMPAEGWSLPMHINGFKRLGKISGWEMGRG